MNVYKVCHNLIDLPSYKISYSLTNGLIDGAFLTLKRYGIPLNKESFKVFEQVINEKLSGNPDIEYEYTEREYNGLMDLQKYFDEV